MHPGVVRRAAGGQGLSLARAWRALGRIADVELGANVFGDEGEEAYWVDAHQMANLVEDRAIALRLTRKVISAHRPRLRDDPRVELRGSSDWLGVTVEGAADVAFAVELGELAAAVYRPADGRPCRPPPTGADLERRRRFH